MEESAAVLQSITETVPDNPVARSQLAETRRRIDAKNRAAQLLAQSPQKLFDAVEQAKRNERDHKFQIEGRRLLASRDQTIEAVCALGAAQRRDRDLDGALNTYRWALDCDDSPASNPMTHIGLAGVLRDLGRLADAERMLRDVRVADRRNHFAAVALSAVLMDRAEKLGERDGLREARQLLGTAWAAGIRDVAIKSAYGRLQSLE